MSKTRILFVEDDKAMAKMLKHYMDVRGYDITHCNNGKAGLETFSGEKEFDLCILDVLMPDSDGFSLAGNIRELDAHIPILFLTSKSMPDDKIKAFKLGADDYITKPFNVEELLLRVNAIIKRQQNEPKVRKTPDSLPNQFKVGKYEFDFQFQRLTIEEHFRKLTTREAELLRFLYFYRNRLIKREMILQEIWGDDDYYKGRSLDVFMSRLRKYLKDDSDIEIINVHAIGFKFIVAGDETNEEEEGKF
jgi:DNA-binding response OmpR family regulator